MKRVILVIIVVFSLVFLGCSSEKTNDSGAATATDPDPNYFTPYKQWDNGNNLAWIPLDKGNLYPLVRLGTLNTLQDWIDDNPGKRILAITSDSSHFMSGGQLGWLIVYENR